MVSIRSSAILLACFVVTVGSAQVTISSSQPPILGFYDISTVAGAVQIATISDDSVTTLPAGTITVGNSLFPAGPKSVSNNGVISGIANAAITYGNVAIPVAPGVPGGITSGAGILMPFWDDLYPTSGPPPTQIWYLNDATNGVAVFMWKDENHFASAAAGEGITFEVQVFQGANCSLGVIQYLYSDTMFGGTMAANDFGANATVGYAQGTISSAGNAQFSYLTPSLLGVTCLTITGSGNSSSLLLTASSPFGNGSLQLDITGGACGGGPYFMPVTLYAGNYPTGWLYGIDIPLSELASEFNGGFPFTGTLSPLGSFTIGPFGGLPSGLQFFALAMNLVGPAVPGTHTPAITYTIP